MDPAAIESRHGSLRRTWIVVLDETVVETLALELRLVDQLLRSKKLDREVKFAKQLPGKYCKWYAKHSRALRKMQWPGEWSVFMIEEV